MDQPIPTEDQFVFEVVPTLPQGRHVREEDARNWYRCALELDSGRFHWHVARLRGLGGSDVGEIVAWKLGVFNVFSTVRDIIDDKLLKRSIQPPNNNIRRGTLLEPVIQRMFLEDFGATSRPDLIRLIQQTKIPEHPWMRGNPDDVVEISSLIYVGDYKSPSDASEARKGKSPLQYAGQVHQYGFIMHKATGEFPHSHLVIAYDHPNGEVIPVEVPFDQQILDAVLEGGDEIWGHVLAGTYPDFKKFQKEDLEYTPEQADEICRLEEQFIRFKLIADAAYADLKKVGGDLEKVLSADGENLLKGQKLPLQVLGGSARQKLDQEKAIRILQEAQVDPEPFMVSTGKMDIEKAQAALIEQFGEESLMHYYGKELDMQAVLDFCEERNIRPPVIESFSPALRASKKGINKEALQIAKQSASRIVTNNLDKVDLGADPGDDLEDYPGA